MRQGRLKVVQESTIWPEGSVRRASINSIGYGGANAHTILEGVSSLAPGRGGIKGTGTVRQNRCPIDKNFVNHANGRPNGYFNDGSDESANSSATLSSNGVVNGQELDHTANGSDIKSHLSGAPQRRHYLLAFSAHNEPTLRANVRALQLEAERWSLMDLSYTLGCRRSLFSNRAFAIADETQPSACLNAESIPVQKVMSSHTVRLGFIFTGQPQVLPQVSASLTSTRPRRTVAPNGLGIDGELHNVSEIHSRSGLCIA